METPQDRAKQNVGTHVAGWVEDSMVVGLGTGSTAAYAIEAIGRRIREERLTIRGIPTSFFAERMARQYGIPLITLSDATDIDLTFDGADEVSPVLDVIKGRGAAHSREKVIAAASTRFVVLVDESKLVQVLGTRMPVPVEVLPMAAPTVSAAIEKLGGQPVLRMGVQKDGPVVTDQGFWVIDASFERIDDPADLSRRLVEMPGVLEHGIFVGMATDVLIGMNDGTVAHRVASRPA